MLEFTIQQDLEMCPPETLAGIEKSCSKIKFSGFGNHRQSTQNYSTSNTVCALHHVSRDARLGVSTGGKPPLARRQRISLLAA
jgi:hypothetical protein